MIHRLRRQLATAPGQLSALLTQAKTEQQELSATQQQLSASEQQARAEQRQLVASQQEVGAEQQELRAESRPDLRIKLSFSLEIVIEVKSSTGQGFRRRVTINPGQIGQLGPREGWAFASGQLVTLSNPAFRPIVRPVTS